MAKRNLNETKQFQEDAANFASDPTQFRIN
jgi:hypothetical protein